MRTCAFRFDYPRQHADLDPGCQFTDETDFFECDGQHFCRFHLRLTAKDGEKTAKGRWQENEIQDFQAAIKRIVNRDTKPNQIVNLTGVIFPADAVFNGKTFGELLCYRTQFTKRAEFVSATFDYAYFSNTQFQGHAFFEDAKFQATADFRHAQFQATNFYNTQFQNSVDFRDAQFQDHTNFSNAQFQDAFFGDAKFQAIAHFLNAQFQSLALFRNAWFQDHAFFRDAKFQNQADFSNAQFQGNAFFIGAEFQDCVHFSHTDFSYAKFWNAQFQATANFSNAQFQTDAEFNDAQFNNAQFQAAVFRDVKFQYHAVFRNAKFQADAEFNDAQFQDHADFRNAQFQGNAFFIGAEFQDCVHFSHTDFSYAKFWNAQFQATANFSNAQFQTDAEFNDAQFNNAQFQAAVFRDVKFQYHAVFRNAKFQADAEFNDAQFQDHADFRNAQFQGDAFFIGAEFQDDTNFMDAKFQGDADFSHTKRTRTANRSETADNAGQLQMPNASDSGPRSSTFQKLDFKRVRIDGVAVFNNRIFNEPADFSRCRFVKAPHFHGCELHQGTEWEGAEFPDRKGLPAASAYRTLRLAMEEIRDRPQEAIFFSHEQQTMRRNPKWGRPERWVSWIYQVTSDYGRSIVRPAVSWLLTPVMFLPIYWLIYWCLTGKPINASLFEALVKFTILQTVKPFGVWEKIHVDLTALFPGDIPFWFQLLATAHSVLSLIFIGLLILALRWLFKRG